MTTELKYKVGDLVFISADNSGSEAVIIEIRESTGSPPSHYKARQTNGQEFWAFDYEISDLETPLTFAELCTNYETQRHIDTVQRFMEMVRQRLHDRAMDHDRSKLERPEVAIFTEYTPKLAGTTYGSDEYKQFLAEMKPALDHHYVHNSHHPEHWPNGINDMSLLDVVEMLVDWKAATMRHNDGDLGESLRINKQRFGISDQLTAILENTAKEMGWLK